MVATSARTKKRPDLSFGEAAPGLRAGVYHRVSSEEQVEGFSLDAQSRATRLYCELHGLEVVREYRDEGRSARSEDLAKRPAFLEMLRDAEAGLLDAVVVHKLDRFARNVVVTLETLKRLTDAGVAFVSVSEHIDTQTPSGRMFLTLIAAFAAYYSDNLSWETRKGKQERKAQGLYNGVLPFGVKKNSAGIPVPDPDTYHGLVLAFKLAAEGKSDKEVADALNGAGFRTTGNRGRNIFTRDTVRRIMLNRFYLGELPDGEGGWVPGKHEPIFDDALFEQVQATRAANRRGVVSVPRAYRHYALSGLAVCGHCGGKLHFYTDRRRPRVYCYSARQAAAKNCPQRAQQIAEIDAQVRAYLGTFRIPEEDVAEVVRLYERAADQRDDSERRHREIAARLERIKEMYGWGDLTREAYQAERDALQAELGTLTERHDTGALLARIAAYLRDLPAAWDAADDAERNALAAAIFQAVKVKDDRVVAVLPQPDFAPFLAAFTPEPDPDDDKTPDDPSGAVNCGGQNYKVRKRRAFTARLQNYGPGALDLPDLRRRRRATHRYFERRTAIPREDWPAVAAMVADRGLRSTADAYGVSHETVRGIIRRGLSAQRP